MNLDDVQTLTVVKWTPDIEGVRLTIWIENDQGRVLARGRLRLTFRQMGAWQDAILACRDSASQQTLPF